MLSELEMTKHPSFKIPICECPFQEGSYTYSLTVGGMLLIGVRSPCTLKAWGVRTLLLIHLVIYACLDYTIMFTSCWSPRVGGHLEKMWHQTQLPPTSLKPLIMGMALILGFRAFTLCFRFDKSNCLFFQQAVLVIFQRAVLQAHLFVLLFGWMPP